MKIPIAQTAEGLNIFLTDDHPASIEHLLPALTISEGMGIKVFGKADPIPTDSGLIEGSSLIVRWLEKGPERSRESRALAMRFLKDTPKFIHGANFVR